MARAFIALGANMGDAEATLLAAVKVLAQREELELINVSYLYKTAPVGYEDQDWFFNGVIEVQTLLEPLELLDLLLAVEQKFLRQRLIRWGPRTLDLDLLMYDQLKVDTPRLTIPHPRMLERAFVMLPLADIIPNEVIEGRTVQQYAEALAREQAVIKTESKLN